MLTPIHDFLAEYAAENALRCHMPGAKGKEYPFDITEIEGADSLFESSGIIRRSEDEAARLFGAKRTLFSCGGSTLAIQTTLALAKAAGNGKNRIAAGRFSHKSLVSACALLGMEIDWIYPAECLSSELSAEEAEAAINPQTAAVFAQSVDYYGGECDVEALARVCKGRGVPLLVDNAHGAYKVFTGDHPLRRGASMTADSAHKTLPCITGGAYLHIADERFIPRAKEIMAVFGSSSPSYLILDSLDLCNRHIALEKERAKEAFSAVSTLKSKLSEAGIPLRKSDALRITADAREYGYSGFTLAQALRENGLECEYADSDYTVLLFSTITSAEECKRAFCAFERVEKKPALEKSVPPVFRAKQEMPLAKAFFAAQELVPAGKATGRICGGIKAPCPPCVPPVMPGELITAEAAELLEYYGVREISAVAE